MPDPVVEDKKEEKVETSVETSKEEKKEEKEEKPDPIKLAEDLGKYKTESEALKAYKEQVDPVIQTIWSDPELLKKVEETHNKRLGLKEEKVETPEVKDGTPIRDTETRDAMVKQIVDSFSREKGIDKLEPDDKKDMNLKIGAMLQELLDPKGNKNLAQIMQTVSLTKLPDYLDHVYYLVNRENITKQAKEEGKTEVSNEQRGIMSGMSSSSIEPDSITLTPKEKEAAQKMGITPEKYLARKKEIASRANELF